MLNLAQISELCTAESARIRLHSKRATLIVPSYVELFEL
jgi:hypothetical protein